MFFFYLIEIALQEELFKDVDELGQGGEGLLVELDELGRPEAVGHVEADVHLDPGYSVRQLHDWDLEIKGDLS